jgi:nucleoid DNA-binding protein
MNLEMAELKTQKNEASVQDFLKGIEDENKRKASNIVSEMMAEVTGAEPKMWGDSIVGFGTYKYKYASGREGEWFLTGFAPRKRNVTLYIMSGFDDYADLLGKLGKFSTGKSCLYINKVEDIDLDVLRELVEKSVKHMVETNS